MRSIVGTTTTCAILAFALAACGGGGSADTPAPAPGMAARQTTVVNATRGAMTVVLSALALSRYYGLYLRPGIGLSLGTIPAAPSPTCDAVTHSASTAFVSQTGSTTLVTTAYYPASDATCSQSPFRVVVMQYAAAAGGALAGFGYQLTYSDANDPAFGGPGVLIAADAIATTIYKAQSGAANLVVNIVPNGDFNIGGSNGPPPQPAPGPFPSTFPSSLPAPVAVTPFGLFFATAQTGSTSTTAEANLGGGFPAPPAFGGAFLGRVGSADAYAVTASAPDARGDVTVAIADDAPRYVVDVTNGGIVPTVTPPYPFPSGSTPLGLGPSSPLAYRSTAANFAKPLAGTVTFDAAGSLVSCSVAATDPLDGVRVGATCTNGGETIAVTATDLLAKASAVQPASIALDAYGYGVGTFAFVQDGSIDSISGFAFQ